MATQPADFWNVCPLCKRLEDGKFRWRRVQDGVMRLSTAQLSALLEGLDWSRVHAQSDAAASRAVTSDELNHPRESASHSPANVL
jgi:transposase